MIRNYLLTAWRNLMRNRLNALLNIVGLSVGIASCLFIFLYLRDELSFDSAFSNAERIYRIQAFYKFDDVDDKFGISPYPVAPVLKQDYPDVLAATRITPNGKQFLKRGNDVFQVEDISYADSNFFQVFDFPFRFGDPANALVSANSIVLTSAESTRLFGDANPVGETLMWIDEPFKVTGVVDDENIRSHFEFTVLASMSSADTAITGRLMADWGNNNSFTYIMLARENMSEEFQPKLDEVVAKYQLPYWQTTGFSGSIEMHAEPLKEIHFNNYLIYDTAKKGNKAYIYIFTIVALITLCIAGINFVNLSVAAASGRVREVALRKVVGATRGQLIVQFIGEALLLAVISSLVAFALVELLLPFFNYITEKSMSSHALLEPSVLGFVFLLIVCVGLLAGSYPAFYISSLPVVAIFRGANTSLGKSGLLRKVLVTLQFTLAIAMIIATLSVLNQLHFMRSKDLGFVSDNMMAITLPQADTSQFAPLTAFRNEIVSLPYVKSVSRSAQIPGAQTSRFVLQVRTSSGEQNKPFAVMFTDENYLTMSNMKVKEGRLFNAMDATNPFGVVLVNRALVNACGWTEPLNERLTIPGDGVQPPLHTQVIGVIEDFHFASLHHPIEPLVIAQQNPRGVSGYLMVETTGLMQQPMLSSLETAWKKYFPNKEFDFSFLNERFARMYESEEKMFSITIYFAVLTMLLCCLGLYGLSAITTQQRIKEIGIRKVMGASVRTILTMLNRDFLWLVFIAILLACPLAWFGVQNWLQHFAYHDEIRIVFFFVAALFAVLITIITVSLMAIRTTLADPIRAIRYE